ncbi:MAG TPA: hypothetical protein GX010_01670 [Erysipelotrichaceae bacterium]|nr:hypothetical protein [Erysipelotrichaceae bacterium]
MTTNLIKKVYVFALSITCLTFAGCKFYGTVSYIDEYETETEEGAIERLRNWDIDLPDNATLITRYYGKNKGWDGGFDGIYYQFEVDKSFCFDTNVLSSDLESFNKVFGNFYDAHEDFDEDKPDFETDMSCLISVRLKSLHETNDNDASSYTHVYLENDAEYLRREQVGDKIFVGKGYFILQENDHNSKYLYSFFRIDSSERRVTIIK